jgi:hypothetical protein
VQPQSQENYDKEVSNTLAVLTLFATPTIAQSFCDCNGSGNVLAFVNKAIAIQNNKIAVRWTGLDSFAMVPRSGPALNSGGPAATTGGGSVGYNEILRNY